MSAGTTIDGEADTEVGEEEALWVSRGLDAGSLRQAPSLSLRAQPLPPPAPLGVGEPPLAMLRTLGGGGMGIVRLARQRSLHREVAVKTVRVAGSDRARRALISEALVTGALQHPNIIPVYSIDEDDTGAPVIVMKRVEGESWHAILHRERPLPADAQDPLEWHLDVLTQVAGAVEFAHRRGILHRDLKPENVMVGELGEVYVLDWGLAVSLREEDRGLLPLAADVHGIAGTPAYMAPEMLEGNGGALGPHTDVYLLGATLHELLLRSPRHLGATVMAVFGSVATSDPFAYPREVPAELAAICNRACARDPRDRFASAEAFRAALLAFRHHRSSIRLSDEAAERLARMRERLSEGSADVDHQREVRDLFGAARFGFEQALAAWPDNAVAKSGAREAIETIVRFELAQRNVSAARAYLDALETPPAELASAVGALEAELQRERAEQVELRRKAREADRALGASGRAVAGVVFGLGAAGSLVLIQWGDESGRFPLSTAGYLGWLVALVVLSSLCVALFRRVLFSNRVNRQISVGTVASLASIVALRFVIVLSGISIHTGFRLELIAYAMGLAMLGVVSNYRVLLASAVCVSGALVDAWSNRGDLYVIAGTVFLAFTALSWAWASTTKRRPRRRGSEPG